MAFIGKIIGSFAAARITKFSTMDFLKIGISMTPGGEMGLIIASLGLTIGLISTGTYSVAVMAVILTTFMAMLIIKCMKQKIMRFPRATADMLLSQEFPNVKPKIKTLKQELKRPNNN